MEESDKILYHYTSLEGLLGIIESKSIWATNILYLNDASELNYSMGLLIDQISTFKNDITIDSEWLYRLNFYDRLIENINKIILDTEHFVFFVCSFSEEKDLLSQWRGYCPEGIGFSLGFSSRNIEQCSKFNKCWLRKCIYDEKKQISKIRGLIEKISLRYKARHSTEERDEQEILLFADLVMDFIELAPTFKHPKFKEEKEWRLITRKNYLRDKAIKAIKYRIGKSMVVPYIEILLPSEGESLFINQIVVGPTHESILSKASVEMLLKSKNVKIDKVQYSTIPYRNW
jgi:hypothetical protein